MKFSEESRKALEFQGDDYKPVAYLEGIKAASDRIMNILQNLNESFCSEETTAIEEAAALWSGPLEAQKVWENKEFWEMQQKEAVNFVNGYHRNLEEPGFVDHLISQEQGAMMKGGAE